MNLSFKMSGEDRTFERKADLSLKTNFVRIVMDVKSFKEQGTLPTQRCMYIRPLSLALNSPDKCDSLKHVTAFDPLLYHKVTLSETFVSVS